MPSAICGLPSCRRSPPSTTPRRRRCCARQGCAMPVCVRARTEGPTGASRSDVRNGSPRARRRPARAEGVKHRLRGGWSAGLADVRRLRTLVALLQLELHLLTLGEAAEALRLDRGVVDEDVLPAAVRSDETKALRVIEPLHCTGRHSRKLLSCTSGKSPRACCGAVRSM